MIRVQLPDVYKRQRLCTLTVLVEELLLHERRFNVAVVKTAALFIVLQLEP